MKKHLLTALLVSSLNLGLANIIDKADAQSIHLNNHQTVVVPLSNADPNRLFVHHDKIIEANCLTGFCEVNFDPSGSVYLTLGQAARFSSGFSIFITTENEQHFTVIGMPKNDVGQTIGFTVAGSANKASTFEKHNPYPVMLVSFIKQMMNHNKGNASTEDLTVVELPLDQKTTANPQGLWIEPIRFFHGGVFQGIVYQIQNKTEAEITLTTQQFYQKSMVAGALSHTRLKPTATGYFYGVIQSEDSDVE